MLHGLGRWLRVAGYDTVIAAGSLSDRLLAGRCAEEDRVLVTKDRHLAAIVAGTAQVVLIQGSGIDETARALRAALDIDWQHAPFTRCIVDNRSLEAAPPYLATQVPERSRAAGGLLRVCPNAAASIGQGAMSAECSSGLLPGNRRRQHPVDIVAAGELGDGRHGALPTATARFERAPRLSRGDFRRRLHEGACSASPLTKRPTGVAARWRTLTAVPTALSPGSR
jgi:uncharacterized protein with PIN domain